MREIVLDTETTGFEPDAGDRIVEIGCVELLNHMPTGKTYHQYLNPERDMPQGAFEVHGLSSKFLADKPVFSLISDQFLEFLGDAKLVIHNATFDMKFINAELGWINARQLPPSRAIDTLDMARRRFPGAQNSLDALCRRFGVDNSAREKHGALLDAEILAEVYLELVGGRQPDFELSIVTTRQDKDGLSGEYVPPSRPEPLAPRLTDAERTAHDAFLADLSAPDLWKLKKPGL